MVLHPTDNKLNRFADGELPPRPRARVAAHLVDCVQCRQVVTSLRALRQAVEYMDEPSPRPELRAELVRKLEAGEAKVLPLRVTRHEAPLRRRFPWRVAAAIGAVVAVGGYQAINTRGLESEASSLEFTPSNPQAGDTITVVYDATSEFAGEMQLSLRGRLWTPEDLNEFDVRQSVMAKLVRNGRHFEGEFVFPDSVVFGLFAVEDLRGTRVDSRGWRGWELLDHDDDGVPTYEALRQKRRELQVSNWPAALSIANETVELYPDNPEAWASLVALEQQYYGPEGFASDSLRGKHLADFERLDKQYRQDDALSSEDIGWMYWYAFSLGLREELQVWRERVLSDSRTSPRGTSIQWSDIAFTASPSRAALEELGRIWQSSDKTDEFLAAQAFFMATSVGSTSDVREWGERWAALSPENRLQIIGEFARRPELRPFALAQLRDELDRVNRASPAHRSLYHTVDRQQAYDDSYRHQVLAALGATLVEDGAIAVGVRYLDQAADTKWNPAVFTQTGDIKLTLGDSAGAVTMWAKAAVDPVLASGRSDSISERAVGLIGFGEWHGHLDLARAEMHHRTLEAARARSLPNEVRVWDAEGNVQSIADLAAGRETLVAFWSWRGESANDLPALQQLANHLRKSGASAIAVTREPQSAALDAYIANNKLFDLPIVFDRDGEAERAFQAGGLNAAYYVLDSTGRILFERSSLNDIARQVAALQAEADPVATDLVAPESD